MLEGLRRLMAAWDRVSMQPGRKAGLALVIMTVLAWMAAVAVQAARIITRISQ